MTAPSPRYRAILLFGPPGSGKGTQGRALAAMPGFFHSATGDMFRGLDPESEAARTMQKYMSRGELVPDEFTVNLWKQHIAGLQSAGKFDPRAQILVLDGIPRSVKQAKLLEDTIDVVKIIHLAADPDAMVARIRGRAFKENRVDDAREDVIRRRMDVYERETRPLLEHYPKSRRADIDALMTPSEVQEAIEEALAPLMHGA